MKRFLTKVHVSAVACAFAAILIVAFASSARAEDIVLSLHQAVPIQLSEPAEGVAIGNPAIARVTVQNPQALLVTGLEFGSTNVVVVGANGRILFSSRIVVRDAASEAVAACNGTPEPPRRTATAEQASEGISFAIDVETRARALSTQTEITPRFLADVDAFATSTFRLAARLREVGAPNDLPCIFYGITADIRDQHQRALNIAATSPSQREEALANFRVLLDDSILLAPMAAEAASEARDTPAPVTEPARAERGSVQTGMASVFPAGARATNSGEVIDQGALLAAHPTWPIPSLVQVTNLGNGREIIVRVDDRAASDPERVIVISRGAADALGFGGSSAARVQILYLGPAPRRVN